MDALTASAASGSAAAAVPTQGQPIQRGGPVKPREQLVLSDDALAEEFTKSLTADNPNAAASLVRFNHKERCYKLEPMVEHLAIHFSRDGNKIHKDSEEAERQAAAVLDRAAREAEEAQRLREALGESADETDVDEAETEEEDAPPGDGNAEPEERSALEEENCDGNSAAAQEAAAKAEVTRLSDGATAAAPSTPPQQAPPGPPAVRFRNQFVFKERAMQTTNHASRDKAVETEPAPKMTFSGVCSRWQIYEWYLEDQRTQEAQRQLKEAAARRTRGSDGVASGADMGSGQPSTGTSSLTGASSSGLDAMLGRGSEGGSASATTPAEGDAASVLARPQFARSAKLLERMVSQNSSREIADDFKYWDDASDALRTSGEGTLLPLWEFETPRGRRRAVTALTWHPVYPDLFAVGYGSFDFMRPTGGCVATFSLKCPNTPECFFDISDAGVTSLAFHPQHGALLAIGLANGCVAVHDIRSGTPGTPLFAANARSGKHDDPVWQVAWAADADAAAAATTGEPLPVRGPLTFFSVSGDGRVCQWTMTRAELTGATIQELRPTPLAGGDALLRPSTSAGARPMTAAPARAGAIDAQTPEEALLAGRVGGTALDVHPSGDGVYLVATEEGAIHKCSTAFNNRVLGTYGGHAQAVYSLQWNPFEGSVFLSASADWSVKLWDVSSRVAVKSFDLGASVGDVAWAPFNSTTLAATTADGRVHVFDLSVNKHEPLCRQKVVKKARLTKLAFNRVHPVLLVGDDRGSVLCLKLSPNLRKVPRQPSAEEETTMEAVQKQRVTRIVDQARRGELATGIPGQPRRTGRSTGALPPPQTPALTVQPSVASVAAV